MSGAGSPSVSDKGRPSTPRGQLLNGGKAAGVLRAALGEASLEVGFQIPRRLVFLGERLFAKRLYVAQLAARKRHLRDDLRLTHDVFAPGAAQAGAGTVGDDRFRSQRFLFPDAFQRSGARKSTCPHPSARRIPSPSRSSARSRSGDGGWLHSILKTLPRSYIRTAGTRLAHARS